MTVDDENSVYVGGLPYDSTEDSVRRALEVYGTVIAVKIVNDREFGGKCYGFVTFTNPRSAVNAINDMDGRTIGGRPVRVNEVKSKSRSGLARDNVFRERYRDRDQDRERDRHREHDRDRGRDTDMDRDRDRDHSAAYGDPSNKAPRHVSPSRDSKHSPTALHSGRRRSLQHERSRSPRGQSPSGSSSDEKHHVPLSPSPRRSERMQIDENSSRQKMTSTSKDRDLNKVREDLDKAIQNRDELKHKVARLEESDRKQISVSDLQKKSQRLEESLAVARMTSLQRQMQLRKHTVSHFRAQRMGITGKYKQCLFYHTALADEIEFGSILCLHRIHESTIELKGPHSILLSLTYNNRVLFGNMEDEDEPNKKNARCLEFANNYV